MNSDELSDDVFLATFERAGFAAADFGHRAHLRMAYLYVTRLGAAAAEVRAAEGIRHLAAAHGHTALYHETLTLAWVRVVALAVARSGASSFAGLLAAHPQLLDNHLLDAHWSREVLFSSRARAEWVPPDLAPIPRVAA